MFNKGAQAMTFITVDEMTRRYPQYRNIVVSNMDAKRDDSEKSNYRFDIIPFPTLSKFERIFCVSPITLKFYLRVSKNSALKRYIELLKSSAAIIDISGYALGSDWGASGSISYCERIAMAKAYKVPVFLMPQSFGPFHYSGISGIITKYFIKKTLKYPNVIMAREQQGADLLRALVPSAKIIKTDDLVLQNKGIDASNIYRRIPIHEEFQIKSQSVAIIPNYQNFKRGNTDALYSLYDGIIKHLLDKKKTVYLLYHSREDRSICANLKTNFSNVSNVVQIEEELSCIEYDRVVSKFDYIIAARYHSIVHAYKNGIPAVILGWAVKYQELAKSVGQEKYEIDTGDYEGVYRVIDQMDNAFRKESETIKSELLNKQNRNVFDLVNI